MKNTALFLSILASLSAGCAIAQQQQSSQSVMRFIAIGDTPYSEKEQLRLQQQIAPAIKAVGVPFVVHYGDIKGGGEACSKELLTRRRDEVLNLLPGRVFYLLPGRVFYTPGDNEWADCDRASLQPPVSELASLDFLRQLFLVVGQIS